MRKLAVRSPSMLAVLAQGVSPAVGDEVLVTGEEAAHALRVRRITDGERVLLLNGEGLRCVARARRVGRDIALQIERHEQVQPASPAVHVFSPTPKGPRAGDLIDLLSQVGATGWAPLRAERSAREATKPRLDRLERVAQAACKQCQRAWTLTLSESLDFADAVKASDDAQVVVASPGGERYKATGAIAIRLLVGPEGGFAREEITLAHDTGAQVVSFGPHIMRVEAAAAAACAIILYIERVKDACDA